MNINIIIVKKQDINDYNSFLGDGALEIHLLSGTVMTKKSGEGLVKESNKLRKFVLH